MLLNTVPLANLQLALCAFERRSVVATTEHLACRARFDQETVNDLIFVEVDLCSVITLKSRHSWAQVNNRGRCADGLFYEPLAGHLKDTPPSYLVELVRAGHAALAAQRVSLLHVTCDHCVLWAQQCACGGVSDMNSHPKHSNRIL